MADTATGYAQTGDLVGVLAVILRTAMVLGSAKKWGHSGGAVFSFGRTVPDTCSFGCHGSNIPLPTQVRSHPLLLGTPQVRNEGDNLEMSENRKIMTAIRDGLNQLGQHGTNDILTKLCEIGRNPPFDCKVGASPTFVCEAKRDWGEWLYDLTWLKYDNNSHDKHLIDVSLVAECEWALGARDQFSTRQRGLSTSFSWSGLPSV